MRAVISPTLKHFVRTSKKLGCTPLYMLNPTHGEIAVVDQQYQNNVYDYHLVKKINSALDEQWIKRTKDMVMTYQKKIFLS